MDNVTLKDISYTVSDIESYFKLSYLYDESSTGLKSENFYMIRHNVNGSDFYLKQNDCTMTLSILGEIATDNKLDNTIAESSYNIKLCTLRNTLCYKISGKTIRKGNYVC